MEFIFGILGFLVAFLLVGAGAVLGWKLNGALTSTTQKVTADALTEKQKQLVREEQEAWMALHNYSAETAYELYKNPNSTAKE